MTRANWSLVDVAAQLLECDERETVLGDLLEAGESAWQGLLRQKQQSQSPLLSISKHKPTCRYKSGQLHRSPFF
jgi:hypothetical protein